MMAAAYEVSEDAEEDDRRAAEIYERLERPEVAELIEASRAEVAVAALCRRWGFPVQVERWLEMADEAMEHLRLPAAGGRRGRSPEDPPAPRPAGVRPQAQAARHGVSRSRTHPFTTFQHPRTQPSTLPLPLREGVGGGVCARPRAQCAEDSLVIPAEAAESQAGLDGENPLPLPPPARGGGE